MKKILGENSRWFFFFFIVGAGLTLGLGWYIQFHAAGNDFWNILYYGRRMTLAEPESLYNGFFPFGYAFLVGQMPFTYVLPLAYLLNALLAGLFTASVSTLISYTRSIPATAIAFLCSITAPFVFQNANTLSPDIGSAAFTAFAVFLLWRNHFEEDKTELTGLNSILIGISLGLAFLWRTHALVTATVIFFGYFLLVGIRPIRSRAAMVASFLSLVLLQVLINLWSGHGFLETAQVFNVYKFFYGVDMTNPPTPADLEKYSIPGMILEDPARTLALMNIPFKFLLSFAWSSVACFLLAPKGRFARYSLFSVLFILLYSIPVAIGDSARAPLMLMGTYTSTLALLLVILSEQAKKYFGRIKWSQAIVLVLFLAAGTKTFYWWLLQDIDFIRANRAERRALAVLEQTLLLSGMKSPTETFADRYDFYTPNTLPYRSRQIGNWSEDWVWGFSDEFPLLPNDSWESFAKACREQGIRFLLLSPNSSYRGEFFPPIYDGEVAPETLGLRYIGQRGKIRIYEFK
ncbi:MAG: hypothetical protein IH589_10920 [Anaerolineales bacterium]|nr:hypothetical protein [Anaerolineales bacterium]